MDAIENIKPRPMQAPDKDSKPVMLRETASKGNKIDAEETKKESAKIQQNHEVKTEQIAESIKKYVDSLQTELKIQVHQKTGKIMVKVISKEDGRVVREVPPEELLNLAAKMEEMTGLLFDKKV